MTDESPDRDAWKRRDLTPTARQSTVLTFKRKQYEVDADGSVYERPLKGGRRRLKWDEQELAEKIRKKAAQETGLTYERR